MNKGKQILENWRMNQIKNAAKDFWTSFGFSIIVILTGILCFCLGYLSADWVVISSLI